MNLAAFFAMLGRDGRVARRNFLPLLLQNLVQPMLYVFVFGRIMTTSGMMPEAYKSLLLPGIIAMIQATETVKLLTGLGEPLIGRLLLYDALEMRFREFRLRKGVFDGTASLYDDTGTIIWPG